MRVSVEITSSLGRRVNVSVPAERVKQAVQERLKNIAKTAKVDGFRPGKLPLVMAEKMFGAAVHGEAAEKLLQKTLFEALQQEQLSPAGYPSVETLKADKEGPLEYTVAFEVYPEIHLSTLSNVTLEKLVVDIQETDLERVIEQMRKQHAEWLTVQRPAQLGDKVTFDLARIVNGEVSGEGQQKDIPLVLDENTIPPGFEVLKGAKVGDKLNINLSEQAGVTAIAEIKQVAEAKLPELNDEFVKKLGIEEGGVSAFRNQVRQHVQEELERVLKSKLKEQVIKQFVAAHGVELPKALIDAELEHLVEDFKKRMKQELGQQVNQLPEDTIEELRKTSTTRVHTGLLMQAFIKQHDIKVDEERVRGHVEKIASAFGDSSALIDMVYRDKNILGNIRSQILEDQVVDKLLEQVKFIEKAGDYQEIMQFRNSSVPMMMHQKQHDDHVHDEHCNHDH